MGITMTERAKNQREDDTVRTILDRAGRRARRVSQRCLRGGLRTPVPGTVERVDPERLARVRPAPQNVEREDTFELGLAARVKVV
jgi:hypothetical protein